MALNRKPTVKIPKSGYQSRFQHFSQDNRLWEGQPEPAFHWKPALSEIRSNELGTVLRPIIIQFWGLRSLIPHCLGLHLVCWVFVI